MKVFRQVFRELLDDDLGATMTEYAVLLTILATLLVTTVAQLSGALITFFTDTASAFGSMK